MRRMLFFDVDDTLVCHQGESHVPVNVVQALMKIQDEGHIVALATGRGMTHVETIVEKLQIQDLVLLNGNHVVAGNETIFNQSIPKTLMEELFQLSKKSDGIGLAFDEKWVYIEGLNERLVTHFSRQLNYGTKNFDETFHFKGFEGIDAVSVKSFSIFSKEIDYSHLTDRLAISHWGDYAVEFNLPDTSKLQGIKKLAAHYNIDLEHVYVFGDNYNDLEMLEGIKHSCCMGNGVSVCKEVASYVTKKSACDDGIVEALQHFKLID